MWDAWRLIDPYGKPYASDQPGTLGGHRRSRIYGRLDCPAALRAIARGGYARQRVFFLNEEQARSAGYRPCAVCMPDAYAAWKAATRGGSHSMRKEQLLGRLDRAWTELIEAYAGLSDVQLVAPGVVGDWSVKDILAHVTTWEEEALKHLPHILAGETSPRYSATFGGIDAFNAQMAEQKRSLSLADVLRQLDATHGRLVEYVRNAPDEQFTRETRFRRRLRLDTYSHYPIHAKMIAEWRSRLAGTG